MEHLFKSNRYCGNCFWFTPESGKCQFHGWEPDICDNCMFFDSKANARKIIQSIVTRESPWLKGALARRDNREMLARAEDEGTKYPMTPDESYKAD